MTIHQVFTGVPFDSNIFLVTGERNILIDTGTGYDSGVLNNIRNILNGRDLDIVILTHCHYDHIGGLDSVMNEFGCEAYAGMIDAIPIRNADPDLTLYEDFNGHLNLMDISDLMDGDAIDSGEHILRALHTPGHTQGGICLFDETTNSLFSGDTVFANGVGRTDLPSGSAGELISSLEMLSNINIKTLYPGHGPCVYEDGNGAIRRGLKMMKGGY